MRERPAGNYFIDESLYHLGGRLGYVYEYVFSGGDFR